jgi:hypothetical protein
MIEFPQLRSRRLLGESKAREARSAVIESVRRMSREAMPSLRARAKFTVSKTDRLLSQSGRLVSDLAREQASVSKRPADFSPHASGRGVCY